MADDGVEEADDPRFTRREAMAALASAGVFGAAGAAAQQGTSDAGAVFGVGGGSMADALQEFRVKRYVVTGDEFDQIDAGSGGRVFKIIDGTDERDGSVYYDDGDSLTLTNAQYGSVVTEDLVIKTGEGLGINAGYSDFSTIQDALDFADTNDWYRIWIPNGTYEESDSDYIITPYPDQTIVGESRDSVTIRNAADPTVGAINFNDNDAEGAILRDVTVEAPEATAPVININRVEIEVHNIRVSGGTATGEGADGISARADRQKVVGCRVAAVDDDEIVFSGSDGICDQNIVEGTINIAGTNVEGDNVTWSP